jgi:hypothetical protein
MVKYPQMWSEKCMEIMDISIICQDLEYILFKHIWIFRGGQSFARGSRDPPGMHATKRPFWPNFLEVHT